MIAPAQFPDLPSVIGLVDWELKRLEDSRREQGWTPWILLAALAALCWQVADYLGTPHRWSMVGLYWALFVVIGLTIETIISSLNNRPAPCRPGIRYFHSNLYAGGRSFRLFTALKIGSAATLICWLTPLAGPTKVAWIGLFGLYVYIFFAHVAGSWTDIPQPVGTIDSNSKHGWVISALFWILHLGLVTSAAVELGPRLIDSYRIIDARIAILAFAVAHLVGLLLGFRVNEPLCRELVYLRRQIAFGELEIELARQRLFELIYGSELSVLLRSRFEAAERSLQALATLPAEAESALLTATEATDRAGALVVARNAVALLDERSRAVEENWDALNLRLFVCRFSGGLPPDVASRQAVLQAQVEKNAQHVKALKSGLNSFGAGTAT